MLFNKQQTLILLRERATNIHFLIKQTTQISLLYNWHLCYWYTCWLHSQSSLPSLDHHFLKYGQLQLLLFKLRAEAGIANPFLFFFSPISNQGPHLYSHADITAFYTSHLVA